MNEMGEGGVRFPVGFPTEGCVREVSPAEGARRQMHGGKHPPYCFILIRHLN